MRILHVFRTPVGGLFRHVRDLAQAQAASGHEVGLVCDSSSGGEVAEDLLERLAPCLGLGLKRFQISRLPCPADFPAIARTAAHAASLNPQIIHCHGAKGGLLGRLAARRIGVASVYTPHGGSLHYRWSSPAGAAFLSAERLLARVGTGLHFVCRYERNMFDALIGIGSIAHEVVHNGLRPEDFETARPLSGAADLLFIGDMRRLKGVDVLLESLALLNHSVPKPVSACLVGDGPDLTRFQQQARSLGLARLTSFPGRLPAREAFLRGRILVMPSRAESFPYIVLEACAAGVPVVASAVGGIPEALDAARLVPPGDPHALAARLHSMLAQIEDVHRGADANRQRLMREFTAADMAEKILAFYGGLLGERGRSASHR